MIMGDFNYPDIDYDNYTVSSHVNSSAYKFFQKTQDLFLAQHVKGPTRFVERHKPSALDYTLTDDATLIDLVFHTEPIGKSDHECLEWSLNTPFVQHQDDPAKYNYWKGDYSKINQRLENINWQILLDVDTVEQKWKIFKTTIHQLVLEYVPLKKTYKKKKSSWIQNATVKMMKTRNTAWKKYRTYPSERNF